MFVEVERDILNGVPREQWAKTVKKNLEERFPNGMSVNGQFIDVTDESRGELAHSGSARWGSKSKRGDRYRATDNLDEILKSARNWVGEEQNHGRKDDLREFARGKVLLRIGKNDYSADVVVGTDSKGNARIHDISHVERTQIEEKITPRKSLSVQNGSSSKRTRSIEESKPGFSGSSAKSGARWGNVSSDNSIPQNGADGNTSTEDVTEMSQSGRCGEGAGCGGSL